jgi:hypothetical protein
MKIKLLVIILLTCTSTWAQQVWQSHLFETFKWNQNKQEYLKVDTKWEKSKFVIHREYIILETKPEVFSKIWWVFYDDATLGDCYITEGDTHKICVDYESDKVYIFGNWLDNRYHMCGVLSKISKVE